MVVLQKFRARRSELAQRLGSYMERQSKWPYIIINKSDGSAHRHTLFHVPKWIIWGWALGYGISETKNYVYDGKGMQ